MLCPSCGKRSAIEYTRVAGGKEKKLTLCSECYKKLYPEGDGETTLSASGDLGGAGMRKCPVCDTTFEDFKRTGLLGCAHCYRSFREELSATIYNLQGNIHHVGKTPNIVNEDNYELILRRDKLKRELERALREGDYVRANGIKNEIMQINRILTSGEEPR